MRQEYNKISDFNPTMHIITLNANGLNSLIKKVRCNQINFQILVELQMRQHKSKLSLKIPLISHKMFYIYVLYLQPCGKFHNQFSQLSLQFLSKGCLIKLLLLTCHLNNSFHFSKKSFILIFFFTRVCQCSFS